MAVCPNPRRPRRAISILRLHPAWPPPPPPPPGFPKPKTPGPAVRRTLTAVPAGGIIRIDGRLDEPVWRTPAPAASPRPIPTTALRRTETTRSGSPTTGTISTSPRAVSIRTPSLVIGRLGRRDELVDSDWFYFGIDPYLDRRSGYFFGVNPAGSIADGTFSNDETKDPTWDGIWESAARVDEKGWTVEMRVPFDQLRFKSEGHQRLGRQLPARHQAEERDGPFLPGGPRRKAGSFRGSPTSPE